MVAIIDPKFVDVDLDVEASKLNIPPGNHWADEDSLVRCRDYGDVEEIFPESLWRQKYEEKKAANAENQRLIKHVLNQKNEGSCVGNMWAQFLMYLMAKQFGLANVVHMSAISCYKQIGSSPNSGANIFDALEKGLEVGALPLDTPENRLVYGNHVMPATGFRTSWPTGWQSTAKFFRFDEQFRIRSRAAGFTALLKGHCIGVGRAGHSILYVDLVWDGSRWLVLYVNSWGVWGQASLTLPSGFGLDSSRNFDSALSNAFVVRTMKIPPNMRDLITPPVTAA